MNNKKLVEWLFEQVQYENDLYQSVANTINEDGNLKKDVFWVEKLERHYNRANAFEEVLINMGYNVDDK